jgi:hypothetical protein
MKRGDRIIRMRDGRIVGDERVVPLIVAAAWSKPAHAGPVEPIRSRCVSGRRTYRLSETAEAMGHVGQGHTRGETSITV